MVSVKVIIRKMPWGWETLLLVNGALGRAKELLCHEESTRTPWSSSIETDARPNHSRAWLRSETFTNAIVRPVESASFAVG